MNNRYQSFKLRDFCKLKYGKSLPEKNRTHGTFPVYGSGGITGYHNKSLVTGPGIIIGRKGSVGSIYYEKNDFFPIDTVFYVQVDAEICDIKFLQYYLPTLSLNSLNNDSAVPGLNREVAEMQKCNIPPLSTQQKIASILTAYDDLIENNNRRIQVLEEMAQRIYREWFVNFRFPGHENVNMVDSELGKIPEGWEVRRLSDKYSIQKGLSYKSKDLVESGGIPMINLKNINKGGGFRSDGVKYYVGEFKETHEVRTGDVIVAVTDMTADRYIAGRAARIPLSKTKAIISTDLVRIEPLEEISQGYTYGLFSFSTLPLYLKEFATGTNVQHLSPSSISIQKIIVPPKSLQDDYGFILENTYALADNLDSKNHTLRKTRDLLLPRLISGRLDVEDLDTEV